MSARAANIYRTVDLESAPKTVLLERLFARCLRDIDDARRAIAVRDIHAKAAALDHAGQIVTELLAALDHAAAPQLAGNLGGLYRFVMARLSEANLSLTTPPLDHAERVMRELGDAFAQAHAKMASGK
jgi:flagellar protein FliS